MASVEKRTRSGKVRWYVRYRTPEGAQRSRTFDRKVDAERFLIEVEAAKQAGLFVDPTRSKLTLDEWLDRWVTTRHDLRASTLDRLQTTIRAQVKPKFGHRELGSITNAEIREWVAEMIAAELSPATTRKAVFALRQALDAAVADRRLAVNPADRVPLPAQPQGQPRFASRDQVEAVIAELPPRFNVLAVVGAYAGLRWGEALGLTRADIDPLRSRIHVRTTAVEVNSKISTGHPPKTKRSVRAVPVARSTMARIEAHLDQFVGADPDALLFAPLPLRANFGRRVWAPAVQAAGVEGFTFHGLRHTFVALLVAAGCNVREVSEWCGHATVGFTLTKYGGLFEDASDAAVDRLDALWAEAPAPRHDSTPGQRRPGVLLN